MNTFLDCIPCFLRQTLEAVRGISDDVRLHEQLLREMLQMTAEMDLELSPPVMGQLIHRRLREVTGVRDPYLEVKKRFNRLALAALPELAALVRAADDPLLAAARCGVAANAIDMATAAGITEQEVLAALRAAPGEQTHGDWAAFRRAAEGAEQILFIADNAGEIGVDRLAVEELGPHRVTVAVRGFPVLNDATLEDAREVGMADLVEVIDNGSDGPGTILEDCSDAFRQRFDRADLVIAKGQGNFETLSHVDRDVAFWFKVKCPAVSRQVGLPVGALALLPPDMNLTV